MITSKLISHKKRKAETFINQFNGILSSVNKFNEIDLELEKEKNEKTMISSLSDKLIGAVCKAFLIHYQIPLHFRSKSKKFHKQIYLSLKLKNLSVKEKKFANEEVFISKTKH